MLSQRTSPESSRPAFGGHRLKGTSIGPRDHNICRPSIQVVTLHPVAFPRDARCLRCAEHRRITWPSSYMMYPCAVKDAQLGYRPWRLFWSLYSPCGTHRSVICGLVDRRGWGPVLPGPARCTGSVIPVSRPTVQPPQLVLTGLLRYSFPTAKHHPEQPLYALVFHQRRNVVGLKDFHTTIVR